MNPIKVIVRGALGKVGREVVNAVPRESDLRLVGAVDSQAKDDALLLADKSSVPFSAVFSDKAIIAPRLSCDHIILSLSQELSIKKDCCVQAQQSMVHN